LRLLFRDRPTCRAHGWTEEPPGFHADITLRPHPPPPPACGPGSVAARGGGTPSLVGFVLALATSPLPVARGNVSHMPLIVMTVTSMLRLCRFSKSPAPFSKTLTGFCVRPAGFSVRPSPILREARRHFGKPRQGFPRRQSPQIQGPDGSKLSTGCLSVTAPGVMREPRKAVDMAATVF